PTFGIATPAVSAIDPTASRWVSGAFDGTSHARPHERSSAPSVASVRATSGTYDHECGTSAPTNTHTFLPASTRGNRKSPRCAWPPDSGPTKSDALTSVTRT